MTLVASAAVLAIAAAAGFALAAICEPDLRSEVPAAAVASVLALVAAAAPSVYLLALIVLVAVLLQARLRPRALPVPGPALAAVMLAAAGFAAVGSPLSSRLAALGCALAIAGLGGALPLLAPPVEGRPSAGGLAWSVFMGPPLAFAIYVRADSILPLVDQRLLGGLLLTLGSLNLGWGVVTTLSRGGREGWRAPLLTEWGIAMIGLGLLTRDGVAAAFLALMALLLLRQPLLLWQNRGAGRLARLALGGSPPWLGFPARLLLLRAATAAAWPFGIAVSAALLLGLLASLRLRSPAGTVDRRLRVGQAVALAVGAALGIFPFVLLRPLGLG